MVAALRVPALPVQKGTSVEVPIDAVVRSNNDSAGYAVYILDRQTDGIYARLKDIQLGKVHGNKVAVLLGLTPGDRVIVSGVSTVWDGSRVNVID
jgi:multidrug efflux pump subunit AcrA (membrane-fusion protein)